MFYFKSIFFLPFIKNCPKNIPISIYSDNAFTSDEYFVVPSERVQSDDDNSLDVPLPNRNRKVLKSERACRQMMKDLEIFERDERQKSEELMMVSFREGVDEVQSLMHTWIKTPVHVMEGITFFSILICLVLYWVEDSVQNRLRKIGFNI